MLLLRRLLVPLFAIAALSGCHRDPLAQALQHISKGDGYFKEQKYPEAILEYKIAVSYVDISTLAHFKLADAYVKSGDVRKAFPEYIKAADLAPDDENVQIKAGNMLLLAGRFQDAKNRARAVLQKNPKSVPGMLLLGNSLAGLKDYENAADVGRKAIDLDPERSGTYRNLGVMELVRGNASSAEQEFKRALELDPKSISACLALNNLYRIGGARAKAEEILRYALGIDPKSVSANEAMAALYIEWKRANEAAPFLETAAHESPDPNGTLALADYYTGMGRLPDATAVLQKLIKDKPEALVAASTRLAVIQYVTGHREEGHKLLDDALGQHPKDPVALSMKARMLLADNRNEEALAAANAAVNADPHSPDAQIILGRVHLSRQETDDAHHAFSEALLLAPGNIDAQLALAGMHVQRNELDSAADFAKQSVEAHPESLDAQLMVIRAMAARAGDEKDAEAALKPFLAKYPKSPKVWDLAGTIAMARENNAAARKAWETALQLDPNYVPALAGIAALYAAAHKPAEAWALVNSRLKQSPNNPSLLLLAAKVRIINSDNKSAEAYLKKTLESDPSSLEAYALLGRIYLAQHRTRDALQEYSQLLHQEPRSVSVLTILGMLSRAEQNTDDAIKWYKKALDVNPRAPVAANNLAWIYVSKNIELNTAVRLAEIAQQQGPNQSEFNDTLGWIYYKRGMIKEAIDPLERAVKLDPKNPTSHFHLGMAYVREGTDPKARVALQDALKLNPNFAEAAEAKKALQTLVY
jgi:tetratricopeptide (TPR) repeat protein